jgi:hypothetical protein
MKINEYKFKMEEKEDEVRTGTGSQQNDDYCILYN